GEDYYSLGQEAVGRWHGLALDKLGLAVGGAEKEEQFTALLYNRHPVTGKQITPRMNGDKNRIPGWDFVFSMPKGVSLVAALFKDEKIIKLFQESTAETMSEIEKFIKVNKHLPEMPTSKQVALEGIELGEVNKLLVKKIEELTLYILQLESRLKKLEERIKSR
ncbi:MAG: hypothetical protein EOP04_31495, partial [Proteobacteria bacterium]